MMHPGWAGDRGELPEHRCNLLSRFRLANHGGDRRGCSTGRKWCLGSRLARWHLGTDGNNKCQGEHHTQNSTPGSREPRCLRAGHRAIPLKSGAMSRSQADADCDVANAAGLPGTASGHRRGGSIGGLSSTSTVVMMQPPSPRKLRSFNLHLARPCPDVPRRHSPADRPRHWVPSVTTTATHYARATPRSWDSSGTVFSAGKQRSNRHQTKPNWPSSVLDLPVLLQLVVFRSIEKSSSQTTWPAFIGIHRDETGVPADPGCWAHCAFALSRSPRSVCRIASVEK